MKVALTLKNYRCFVRPTTIPIVKDFTAFVGINNAGKSALMRFLLEFRTLFSRLIDENQLIALLGGSQQIELNQVLDREEIFSNRSRDPIEITFEFTYEPDETSNHYPSVARITVTRDYSWQLRVITVGGVTIGGQGINRHGAYHYSHQSNGQNVDLSAFAALAEKLRNTLYIGPFRNTVSVGTNQEYIDIQIGEAFIASFRQLKSGNIKKFNQDILRLTEDIARIFEFNSLSIDSTADNKSLQIVVNGRAFKQHELGSGLAQFIIVLVNASTKNPAYILIDEPELGLHPRLQLDFLTTLATYATEGVWFSTHSIGLARSTTAQIYSVRKVSDGDSQVTLLNAQPRLSEFLGEMSFSAHQDLGAQQILLVEGPTDVTTFQQILRKMGKEHQVVMLSVSGRFNGNMTQELQEVLRITNRVSAIMDSEKTSENSPLSQDRANFVTLCGQLQIPCHVLQKRATENYFPDAVVKSVYGQNYRSLGDFEAFSTITPRWAKSENWRLAHAMSLQEIQATDLGAFLNGL